MKRIGFVFLMMAVMQASASAQGIGVAYGNNPFGQVYVDPYTDELIGVDLDVVQSGNFSLTMPVHLSERLALEPNISLVSLRQGDENETSMTLGTSLRFTPSSVSDIFYLGGVFLLDGLGTGDYLNISVGPLMGGEYFLDDGFSLGAEAAVMGTGYDVYRTNPQDRIYSYSVIARFVARAYFGGTPR